MSDEEWGPRCCEYGDVRTFIFDENVNQVARISAAFWPSVGAVIELGNPNRDAQVREVRLSLPQSSSNGGGGAVIFVFTDDAGVEGRTISRRPPERCDDTGQPSR